jgi:hypothetical protein
VRDEVATANAKRNVLATRFVEVEGPLPTPCRVWTLGTNGDGYGYVSFRKKAYRVHRLAWVLTNGAIPPGLVVRHRCDLPPCFEVSHLLLGSEADNAADRIARVGRECWSRPCSPDHSVAAVFILGQLARSNDGDWHRDQIKSRPAAQ